MENMVFACVSSGTDIRTLYLVASIREFAGTFSDCPIYIVVPKSENKLPSEYVRQLLAMDAKFLAFTPDSEFNNFPFAGFVQAAATAEAFAKENKQLLAWLTLDTLVLNPPTEFSLDKDIKVGYAPVHHTLIGSIYDKPIDSFWNFVYDKCGVSTDNVFPVRTHVDGNMLRPYFNAGCLIIRPVEDLFHLWLTKFKEIYQHPKIIEYYEENYLYKIFIHQVVLAGVILSSVDKEELMELPFNYNYPLHLYSESEEEFRPKDFNKLITARYEEIQVWDKIPFQNPIKTWLKEQQCVRKL
ncbi:MAG: hypothetical protein ACW98I_06215 [Candidatus Hodarchaeales archaeon]|jgi:hypothetical protein